MDKAQVLALIGSLVIKAAGKILSESEFFKKAESGDTFGVFPVKGGVATVLPGNEIVKNLKANFPKSAFTFFSKPMEKEEAKPEKSEEGKGKGK